MEANLDKPDFGIQGTTEIAGGIGDANLLEGLLSPETSTADPDDITSSEEEEDKIVDNKKSAKKEEDDNNTIDEDIAASPEALTNFLLGEEEEEEEEEEEGSSSSSSSDNDSEESSSSEEDIEVDNDKKGENKGDNDGYIAFDALANELADLGVFNRQEGEEEGIDISTPEDFLERFNQEKAAAANQMVADFIGQFGQEYQDAFQAIYVNGVNPSTYFQKQQEIISFKDMDMSKEQNQEKVARQALAMQGLEADDIDAEVEKLKNYGDLEETSKRYHKALVKNEEKELAQATKRAEEEQQRKLYMKQQYQNNVVEVLTEKLKAREFDGIPVTPKVANELQDFLLVDKWKTSSGEQLTDFDKTILDLKRPENHAQKVKVALLLKLLEKDPTLSTIQKRGVSKKSSQLFKTVARQKTVAKRAATDKKQPAKSWFQ